MTKVLKTISLILFLAVMSCSDGMQIEQKINSIIEENKVTTLSIQFEQNDGTIRTNAYQVKDLVIENQLLKSNNEYFNLGQVKSFKVDGDKLEIRL